jgi:serine/threonine protein phosphatase PrpC
VRIGVGAKTDVGLVREGNEDSLLIEEPLFVVADGMGGHLAGDVASSTAVGVIADRWHETNMSDEDGLRAVVREANAAIWEKSQADPSLRGMGTTCTLVRVDDSQARLAHVGDSRAYLFRDGELSQLTEDHTMVGRMVREGRLSIEEAEHHPQRNIITRALGVDTEVDVDTFSFDLVAGDRILICSDGLTSMVSSQPISEILANEPNPQRAAEKLVQLAIDNGGEDNVTVVLLDIDGTDAAAGPREESSAADTGRVPAAAPAPPPGAPADVRSSSEDTVMTAVPSPSEVEPRTVRPRRSGWISRLAIGVVVVAVLAVGGYFLVRSLLDNSYFVRANDDGLITLYRGIPDEIAGLSFREVERETDLTVDDLPEFLQEDVQEGMKFDSLAAAEDTIANLEERAEESREPPAPKKKRN